MTGFRVKTPLTRLLKSLGAGVRAEAFSPEVKQFLKQSLTTAIQSTPARSLSVIKKAQKKQYLNRVNYIPSFHELQDPTLISKPDGDWLFCGGKWYRPNLWHLPDHAWSAYEDLLHEKLRRLSTDSAEFIAFRAQARWLYKKSWWEIGQSVGIDVPCSQQVKDSHSRRTPSQLRNGHRQNPPKGYAQVRGGKDIYSIVVYNPFLDEQTAYWFGSGKDIIAQAMAKHRVQYEKKVADKTNRLLLKILRDLLA